MSDPLRLTLGCTFSDRIEALLDGRVAIDGVDLAIDIVEPQRLFRATLNEARYDLAELSMGSHIAAMGAGRREYAGLPVFLSRSFRHSNLYVRTDRVKSPGDLAGKRIGLVDFQQTAALWLRGLLADDHGVDRTAVEWVTAGLHAPVPHDRMALPPAPGIVVRRDPDATLDGLLRAGLVDAVISPTRPRCATDPAVPVDRLWPDPRAAEQAWWARRRLFPIMHVLVVRRRLIEARPGLAGRVTAAFEEARRLAAADLAQRDFPKLTLPWLPSFAADAHAALGGDPWTYGVEANRETLRTMLRYAAADGLTPADLRVDDLFG